MGSTHQLDRRIEDVDKAMRLLRTSMKGIPIRFAGFKKDHDKLARSVAQAAVLLESAKPMFGDHPVRARGRR
jgi:hypothetical protein